MKVILPNGAIVEGTLAQVQAVAKSFGYSINEMVYNSSSRGPILIHEMETTHLRNAILKQYREWVGDLHEVEEPSDMVAAIFSGITDPTFVAMLKEFSTREAE